jgi:hypothetical protein
MCAEINSVKPASEEYKLQVSPAKTLVRVAVANPAYQPATADMKPGGAIVQAVMRKREGSRAPLIINVRGGRAFIFCAQGNTEVLIMPDAAEASPGSKTTACTKGLTRELGRTLGSRKRNFKVRRQGPSTKSITILTREIRCLHSSRKVR